MGKAVPMQGSTQRVHRQAWFGRLRSLCVALLLPVVLSSTSLAWREAPAASFTIDVDQAFSEVVVVVEDVARSGVIKGTFEYTGDEQLQGAQFEQTSRLFPAWTGPGKVFFKVRNKTLAPKHFINSNDVGTVAVRYIVQENGPSTRLMIDAVFVENAGHHGHPSDGYVETCEFAEIGKRLKEFDQQQTLRASGHEFSPSHESSSQPDQAADAPAGSSGTADIDRAIANQKAQLAADTANLEQLEAQARQIRTSEFVRISAERAELKVSPYSHARVVKALGRGQEVTVLAKSTYWYRVRAEDGQEGWISHTAVEARP